MRVGVGEARFTSGTAIAGEGIGVVVGTDEGTVGITCTVKLHASSKNVINRKQASSRKDLHVSKAFSV
jgi:hypothetical protein